MIHRIRLSNDQILGIEEAKEVIHITLVDYTNIFNDVWLCTISSEGVLVKSSIGKAVYQICEGLKND